MSISAIAPGGKAITGSVLAAKVPVKTTMVSFIKKIGDTGEKITTHLPEGYQLTKLKSSGQKVYSNGKNWITPDITSHKWGIWKMFDKESKVGSTLKQDRLGTFDANLNKIAD